MFASKKIAEKIVDLYVATIYNLEIILFNYGELPNSICSVNNNIGDFKYSN